MQTLVCGLPRMIVISLIWRKKMNTTIIDATKHTADFEDLAVFAPAMDIGNKQRWQNYLSQGHK